MAERGPTGVGVAAVKGPSMASAVARPSMGVRGGAEISRPVGSFVNRGTGNSAKDSFNRPSRVTSEGNNPRQMGAYAPVSELSRATNIDAKAQQRPAIVAQIPAQENAVRTGRSDDLQKLGALASQEAQRVLGNTLRAGQEVKGEGGVPTETQLEEIVNGPSGEHLRSTTAEHIRTFKEQNAQEAQDLLVKNTLDAQQKATDRATAEFTGKTVTIDWTYKPTQKQNAPIAESVQSVQPEPKVSVENTNAVIVSTKPDTTEANKTSHTLPAKTGASLVEKQPITTDVSQQHSTMQQTQEQPNQHEVISSNGVNEKIAIAQTSTSAPEATITESAKEEQTDKPTVQAASKVGLETTGSEHSEKPKTENAIPENASGQIQSQKEPEEPGAAPAVIDKQHVSSAKFADAQNDTTETVQENAAPKKPAEIGIIPFEDEGKIATPPESDVPPVNPSETVPVITDEASQVQEQAEQSFVAAKREEEIREELQNIESGERQGDITDATEKKAVLKQALEKKEKEKSAAQDVKEESSPLAQTTPVKEAQSQPQTSGGEYLAALKKMTEEREAIAQEVKTITDSKRKIADKDSDSKKTTDSALRQPDLGAVQPAIILNPFGEVQGKANEKKEKVTAKTAAVEAWVAVGVAFKKITSTNPKPKAGAQTVAQVTNGYGIVLDPEELLDEDEKRRRQRLAQNAGVTSVKPTAQTEETIIDVDVLSKMVAPVNQDSVAQITHVGEAVVVNPGLAQTQIIQSAGVNQEQQVATVAKVLPETQSVDLPENTLTLSSSTQAKIESGLEIVIFSLLQQPSYKYVEDGRAQDVRYKMGEAAIALAEPTETGEITGDKIAELVSQQRTGAEKSQIAIADEKDGSFEELVANIAKHKSMTRRQAGKVYVAEAKAAPPVELVEEGSGGKRVTRTDVERVKSKKDLVLQA